MSLHRQVRRVPADWQHPLNPDYPDLSANQHVPLMDGFKEAARVWDEGAAKWEDGLCRDYSGDDGQGALPDKWTPISPEHKGLTYAQYSDRRPVAQDYMPEWPEKERTHFQMYETTTEGTPISPVFEGPEALARWLSESQETLFGSEGRGTMEDWLDVIGGEPTGNPLVTKTGSALFPETSTDQPAEGPVL